MIGRFGLFIAGTALWAQSTTTRGIVPEEVVQARPAAVTPATVGKPKYQPVAAAVGKPAAPGRQIGVTIWRLRSATAADAGRGFWFRRSAKRRNGFRSGFLRRAV